MATIYRAFVKLSSTSDVTIERDSEKEREDRLQSLKEKYPNMEVILKDDYYRQIIRAFRADEY